MRRAAPIVTKRIKEAARSERTNFATGTSIDESVGLIIYGDDPELFRFRISERGSADGRTRIALNLGLTTPPKSLLRMSGI